MSIVCSFISGERLVRGYLSSRCQATGGWDGAKSRLLSGTIRGVSLDCFDTLLARRKPDWEQIAVAELVAKAKGIPASHVRTALGVATHAARKKHGGPDNEPDAFAIWSEFCQAMGLTPRLATSLAKTEYSLLETSVAPNPCALDFMALVEQQKLPWVVCSDSRWHNRHLFRLLTAKGFPVREGRIFSSCARGLSKFRGNLYSLVQEYWKDSLGPAMLPGDILHVGDNLFTDCCSAACFGWQATKVPPARLAGPPPAAELASPPIQQMYRKILAVLA